MGLSLPEKLLNVALGLAALGAYAALAVRFLGGRAGWRARLAELLAWREPAVLLDSARVVVLLAWIGYVPDVAWLKRSLEGGLASPAGIFRWIDLGGVPVGALDAAAWVYRGGIALAAFGIAARSAACAAGLANVFLWSVAFCFEHTAHFHEIPLVLLALSLSPVRSPSPLAYLRAVRGRSSLAGVGEYPAFLRWAVIFAVGTAYFQAGVEKLIRSGPYWFNGTTLAGHLLRVGTELGLRVAEAPRGWLVFASLLSVAWELSFFLVLFYPRLRLPAAASAMLFHFWLLGTMNLSFVHLVMSLAFLVPPYAIAVRLLRGPTALGAPAGGPVARRHRACAAGLAVLLGLAWVPTFARSGVYPFLSYDMFNGFYRGGEVLLRRAHLFVEDARGWRELEVAAALEQSPSSFTEQTYYRYLSTHPRHTALAGTRDQHCRNLLRLVVRRAAPGATALKIEGDVILAGETRSSTTALVACTR